jgi:hypothetical protein
MQPPTWTLVHQASLKDPEVRGGFEARFRDSSVTLPTLEKPVRLVESMCARLHVHGAVRPEIG